MLIDNFFSLKVKIKIESSLQRIDIYDDDSMIFLVINKVRPLETSINLKYKPNFKELEQVVSSIHIIDGKTGKYTT